MLKSLLCLFLVNFLVSTAVFAADKLVLEIDFDRDVLSLSHNIENFIFPASRNYWNDGERNVNDVSQHAALRNHLALTALVRMGDEIVGFVTEQEIVFTDPENQHPMADSMWMFRLNRPGLTGFLAVKQREDAHKVHAIADKVLQNPEGPWEDKIYSFLSTSEETRVQFATDDLAVYQGGIFEEYNAINPGDYARFNRFKGQIKFVIHPKEQR